MNEERSTYQINPTAATTKNYSLTMEHIAKVSDMAQRLGISQGEVVRRAIDLLWNQLDSNANHES